MSDWTPSYGTSNVIQVEDQIRVLDCSSGGSDFEETLCAVNDRASSAIERSENVSAHWRRALLLWEQIEVRPGSGSGIADPATR